MPILFPLHSEMNECFSRRNSLQVVPGFCSSLASCLLTVVIQCTHLHDFTSTYVSPSMYDNDRILIKFVFILTQSHIFPVVGLKSRASCMQASAVQ